MPKSEYKATDEETIQRIMDDADKGLRRPTCRCDAWVALQAIRDRLRQRAETRRDQQWGK